MSLSLTNLVGFGAGSESVGNDLYTTVLLHCDGSDGATTFTDSCAGATPHTFTAVGNAQIDTAQAKFGGASGLFDGTGDWLTTPDSADFDFGSGNFTIDLWCYRNSFGALTYTITHATSFTFAFSLRFTAANVLEATCQLGGTLHTLTGTTTVSSGGWHHLALVRNSGTLTLYLDGTSEASASVSGALYAATDVLYVGAGPLALLPFNGWIDEVRLSKGIARWTANFVPPVEAYGP